MDSAIISATILGIAYVVAALIRRGSLDWLWRKGAVVVWTSRFDSYPKLKKAVEKTKRQSKIIAHDSLWLGQHPLQMALKNALERGVEVELILADPTSAIYEYRYRLIHGLPSGAISREEPAWIREWEHDHKKTFRLIYTEHLFSGPFVLVDDVLHLGIFSPKAESDRLPAFQISTHTKTGEVLRKNIERWKNSLLESDAD